MPKRYADSIAYDLRKYDQLKKVHRAQSRELTQAYEIMDIQVQEINELDSLNSDNVSYYETVEIPKHKKKIRVFGLVIAGETLLLLLLLL